MKIDKWGVFSTLISLKDNQRRVMQIALDKNLDLDKVFNAIYTEDIESNNIGEFIVKLVNVCKDKLEKEEIASIISEKCCFSSNTSLMLISAVSLYDASESDINIAINYGVAAYNIKNSLEQSIMKNMINKHKYVRNIGILYAKGSYKLISNYGKIKKYKGFDIKSFKTPNLDISNHTITMKDIESYNKTIKYNIIKDSLRGV